MRRLGLNVLRASENAQCSMLEGPVKMDRSSTFMMKLKINFKVSVLRHRS